MANTIWKSIQSIRREQFASLIPAATQNQVLTADEIDRIVIRRDERERLLVKNLFVQMALYVALVAAPTSEAIPLFGIPFKAVHEIILFLLIILNLLAVFLGMTINVLNDFIITWQSKKYSQQFQFIGKLAFSSLFSPDYWFPPPSPPLTRGKIGKAAALFSVVVPPLVSLLLFIGGLILTVYAAREVWHSPSLPPPLSKMVVLLFVASYLVNFAYAVIGHAPLPYLTNHK